MPSSRWRPVAITVVKYGSFAGSVSVGTTISMPLLFEMPSDRGRFSRHVEDSRSEPVSLTTDPTRDLSMSIGYFFLMHEAAMNPPASLSVSQQKSLSISSSAALTIIPLMRTRPERSLSPTIAATEDSLATGQELVSTATRRSPTMILFLFISFRRPSSR